MKKCIFFCLFALVALVASVNAQSPVAPASDPQFLEIYNQAIELNRETYPDFRRIPINAPVAFPDYDENGVIYFPARVPENGKNDCIWYLSLEYQKLKAEYDANANQQEFVEPDFTIIEPVVEPIEESSNPDFWAWFIIIGLIILVIAAYLLNRFRPWERRRNSDSNPVIAGGLSPDRTEAISQLNSAYPTLSRVVDLVRGYITTPNEQPVEVRMQFSDGVRKTNLINNEDFAMITREDGTTGYYRHHCGNRTAERFDGSSETLPEGVTFVPYNATPVTSDAPIVEAPIVEAPITTASAPVSEIANILAEAGMMKNKPSKIVYKDLLVEFFPTPDSAPVKKEKAKDK